MKLYTFDTKKLYHLPIEKSDDISES